jgi:DNA-binding CsgD family transcriptional regulator
LSYPHGMLDLMTAHAHSEVLVGREADLAALRDALKRTRSAEPSTVLVGGEAGVGKTRLVEEFCRSLSGEPVRLLTGQCLELGEEGLPFAPFAGAVRELLRAEGPAIFDGREREFARLLPELGPPPEPGDARRGLLFESVGALLARLSTQQPLVLVIEDLHWADRSTRDLIGFLVRSAHIPQLLLILTYRTDELHRGHPLRPFLAELDRVRGVQRLEVSRLDRDGTAEMLGHLLGVEPDPPTVDAVNDRAQGNPFFIEQFAASADPACSDIPTSLRDLLLSRVDLLPEPAQRVLRVAAVGGTRFGHELLARVAEIDEAALESALRTIVAAQLVVVDPAGGYEFRHALVREAVHDDLLPGEHARLHARYARAVEAEPHLVAMGRAAAEIAHHWHAAHDHPRALVTAKAAADEAGRRFAYAEQARLLDRVIELWEQVPDADTLLGVCHLDLLEEAALVAIDSGEHMRALSLTRAALSDLDAEAEPLRAARLLVRRVKLLRNAGKSDGVAESHEAYRLLAGAPPGADRVRLLTDVAYEFTSVDSELAAKIAGEAMAEATELGDLATLVTTEITFGQVCAGRLPPAEGLPTIVAAADRARTARDLPGLTRALVNISDSLFELGRYEESAAAAAEGVPDADRVGVGRTTGVFLLANDAEALMALGRWDEADARLAEAARLDPPGLLALPWLRLRGKLRLYRGHEGAEALLVRAVGFLGRPFLYNEDRLSLLELRILLALHAGDLATATATARMAVAEPVLFERPRYAWPLLAAAARAATAASALVLQASGSAVLATLAPDLAAAGSGSSSVGGAAAAGAPSGVGSGSAGVGGAAAPSADGSGSAALMGGSSPVASAASGSVRYVPSGEAAPGYATYPAGGDSRNAAAVAAAGAAELVELIRDAAGRLARTYPAELAFAAEVAALLDGGEERWQAAVAAWRSDGHRYRLAEALLGLAEAQATDRTAAAEILGEVIAIAESLGAVPMVEAADTLARRLGIRPAGAARAASPIAVGTELLTAREREVLRLVAEGQSNSRIAASLYISPKTASVHVSRIIAKLEVANRVEAAAVAHRLGLLSD